MKQQEELAEKLSQLLPDGFVIVAFHADVVTGAVTSSFISANPRGSNLLTMMAHDFHEYVEQVVGPMTKSKHIPGNPRNIN